MTPDGFPTDQHDADAAAGDAGPTGTEAESDDNDVVDAEIVEDDSSTEGDAK